VRSQAGELGGMQFWEGLRPEKMDSLEVFRVRKITKKTSEKIKRQLPQRRSLSRTGGEILSKCLFLAFANHHCYLRTGHNQHFEEKTQRKIESILQNMGQPLEESMGGTTLRTNQYPNSPPRGFYHAAHFQGPPFPDRDSPPKG